MNRSDISMDDELEQLLREQLATGAEELAPSSGFVVSVMEAIEQKAAEPLPIGFPWRRVLPGAIALGCTVVVFLALLLSGRVNGQAVGLGPLRPMVETLGPLFAAACLSAGAVLVSFRLAGRG
jgi:hypothetical protein